MEIKKITAAVFAALCAVPVIAAAESAENSSSEETPEEKTFTENGIEYIIDEDGNARVINIADKELTEVVIPKEVRGHKVTALGDFDITVVFKDCTRIKSVMIPDTVTSIGHFCFYGVDSLKDVYYAGTGEQWRRIMIGTGNNDALDKAEFHFDAGAPEIDDIPDLTELGDANCDGTINARDATAVLKHAAQLELLEGVGLANADVNSDGMINAKDATQILKIAAGLA